MKNDICHMAVTVLTKWCPEWRPTMNSSLPPKIEAELSRPPKLGPVLFVALSPTQGRTSPAMAAHVNRTRQRNVSILLWFCFIDASGSQVVCAPCSQHHICWRKHVLELYNCEEKSWETCVMQWKQERCTVMVLGSGFSDGISTPGSTHLRVIQVLSVGSHCIEAVIDLMDQLNGSHCTWRGK